MESDDFDQDLHLTKACGALLTELEGALPTLLWKPRSGNDPPIPHRYIRNKDLDAVIELIEPFQSEPYLLDAKLKDLLPPLVKSLLEDLQRSTIPPPRHGCVTLRLGASHVLYTFCKVRGEKVVIDFLNNEPYHLDSILSAFDDLTQSRVIDEGSWVVNYVLLLWLRHLLLAPFDLVTISKKSESSHDHFPSTSLPDGCPPVIVRVWRRIASALQSTTRERDAAAKALVRLVNRPDVQRLGISSFVVNHALQAISSASKDASLDHQLGFLQFMVGITASSQTDLDNRTLSMVWPIAQEMYEELFVSAATGYARCRVLFCKLLRNITVFHVKSSKTDADQDLSNGNIEESIQQLFVAIADKDTQVRSSAAKVLSQIIVVLEDDLSSQVIEALFDEHTDIAHLGSSSLTETDPAKWHGIVLTLAHLLFRRALPSSMLQRALNILVMALNYEHRSPTGSAQGTATRDAACFAIWSVARRFSTNELNGVKIRGGHANDRGMNEIPSIRYLACQLLAAACIDPAGNIRRGCSAALQEMVGRHPDQVHEGISLIQIIDYQAVGLRRRAMTDLTIRAAELNESYWEVLITELTGWRGLGSFDIPSRAWAADAIGSLRTMRLAISRSMAADLLSRALVQETESKRAAKDELRRQQHGALLALASIAEHALTSAIISDKGLNKSEDEHDLYGLVLASWRQFAEDPRGFHPLDKGRAMDLTAVRADVPAAFATWLHCTISYIASFGQASVSKELRTDRSLESLVNAMRGMFQHSEESLILVIPKLVDTIAVNLSPPFSGVFNANDVVAALRQDSKGPVVRGAARPFALAATVVHHELLGIPMPSLFSPISELLSAPVIEWRVIGLRAIDTAIQSLHSHSIPPPQEVMDLLLPAIDKGLNDYTITERGDVGSLARIQALHCTNSLWTYGLLSPTSVQSQALTSSVLRLSLEKLDRVRLLAAQTWASRPDLPPPPSLILQDVSSEAYYKRHAQSLLDPDCPTWHLESLLLGLASAGVGAEPLQQAAHAALVSVVQSCTTVQANRILTVLSGVLKGLNQSATEPSPALDLLAFILDYTDLTGKLDPHFPWRVLLSRVMTSHYKSGNVRRLLAAVEVYRVLHRQGAITDEVLRKLVAMAGTNPHARVRERAGEALWLVLGVGGMRNWDWSREGRENKAKLKGLGIG